MYSNIKHNTSDRRMLSWAALIAILTFIVYLPALQNEFVNWDDPVNIYENQNIRSIDLHFLSWALTDISTGLWSPILWLSFALDYAVWGLNPLGYHLTNIVIHSINTFIVFVLLITLFAHVNKLGKKTILAGTIASLLFGIHPLHVESVAWVTERKDVLYSFFFLSSIIAYLRYASTNLKRHYLLSIIFFIFSLMSKPMAVLLPVVLMIIDFYPLRRLTLEVGIKSTVITLLEKFPFLLFSFLVTMLTLWVEASGYGLESPEIYPLTGRIFIAAYSYIHYLFRMVLPFNLSPIYASLSIPDISSPEYIAPFIGLMVITLFSIRSLKRGKIFFTIWVYYMATLMPVAGWRLAADRYTYLPSIGPFLLMGLGIVAVFERCSKRLSCLIVIITLLFLSLILGMRTITQIAVWQNSVTLWSYEIKMFPDIEISYYNRGKAYDTLGAYQEAIRDFSKVIELDPKYIRAYNNRGVIYGKTGNYQQALMDFTQAIKINPRYAEGYYNRGFTHTKINNYQQAIDDYNIAIKLSPKNARYYRNRGEAYRNLGNHEQAQKDFEKAEELSLK